MIILTQKVNLEFNDKPHLTVFLTAEERTKVRQTIEIKEENSHNVTLLKFNLPRGELLNCEEILTNEEESFFVKMKKAIEN